MKKKIFEFAKGLFEFTKILTISFTVFYFKVMMFTMELAAEAVKNNYLGSLAFLTAAIGAVNGAAAIFYRAVIGKSERENLNKHKPETAERKIENERDTYTGDTVDIADDSNYISAGDNGGSG